MNYKYYIERRTSGFPIWREHSQHVTYKEASIAMKKAKKYWPLSDWRITNLVILDTWVVDAPTPAEELLIAEVDQNDEDYRFTHRPQNL